ncbi:hypothetical protein CHELA20_51204 [Hyphomicrobiales bacterium]|nr:hypothetical protein CHELA41_23808 [Hyphomicrobiales bacterium]CAH1674417.1 hypothetical protein CHELA20_51204 [Hyphomicrobiales bacterium]
MGAGRSCHLARRWLDGKLPRPGPTVVELTQKAVRVGASLPHACLEYQVLEIAGLTITSLLRAERGRNDE